MGFVNPALSYICLKVAMISIVLVSHLIYLYNNPWVEQVEDCDGQYTYVFQTFVCVQTYIVLNFM